TSSPIASTIALYFLPHRLHFRPLSSEEHRHKVYKPDQFEIGFFCFMADVKSPTSVERWPD
ncbi:hypothetical protein L195_g047514, partial [Trifolium pratense]